MCSIQSYFNPRAPCGARLTSKILFYRGLDFNPRAPCGARRSVWCFTISFQRISTHAPLAGRDLICSWVMCPRTRISTHAPLAGRDVLDLVKKKFLHHFNPRAPCGARPERVALACATEIFQPTRPLRGATVDNGEIAAVIIISTHAPLAGRDTGYKHIGYEGSISTHAPLAGRDATGSMSSWSAA